MRKSPARTGHRPLKALAAAAFVTSLVLAGTAGPAQAAATLTLSTSQVAIAGGTVLHITGGTALTSSLGIRFAPSSGACPTTYDAATPAGTVSGGAITAFAGGATAYVTTPALPAGTYKPCLYVDTTSGALFATDTFAASGIITVTAVNIATLSPNTGVSGEKITLTATTPIFTAASYPTQFVSGVSACPATYTTASAAIIVGTTVKTSTQVLTVTVPTTLVTGTAYHVCSYVASVANSSALAAAGDTTFASFGTTLPGAVLAPTGGSTGAGTTTTVTVPVASSVFTGEPDVVATRNSCPLVRPANGAMGTATTGLDPYPTTTTKISNNKLAVTMPVTVIGSSTAPTTAWNVCTYASNSTGAALIASPAVFTVAPALAVASAEFAVGSGSAAATGSGPAQGGSLITVSNLTGIPTAPGALLSASLGGSPINITAVNSSTSFTGITSAHSPGAVPLSVTTAGGTKTMTTTPYTYTYGITVTPNTAASGTTPVLDITGAGFGSLTFGDVANTPWVPAANTSYVLLTNNAWNAQTFSDLNALIAATPPTSYCNTVLPISDSEIICTLNLTARIDSVTGNAPTIGTNDVPAGSYTITVVNDADDLDSATSDLSIVSSGSTFTVAPF